MGETIAEKKYPDGVPALLTVREAARIIGVSRPTMYKLLDENPEAVTEIGESHAKRVKTAWLFSYVDCNGERNSVI